MTSSSKWVLKSLIAALCGVLIGCASGPAGVIEPMPPTLVDWSARELPGKRATNYSFVHREGQACVLARSEQSVSLWRRAVHVAPDQLDTLSTSTMSFSSTVCSKFAAVSAWVVMVSLSMSE